MKAAKCLAHKNKEERTMSFQMIYGILFILWVVAVGLWLLGETRPMKIVPVQELPTTVTCSHNESRFGKTLYLQKETKGDVVDIRV